MRTFDELVKQGKVRYIGASNFTPARLAEAQRVSEKHNYVRYESLQPLYNLLDRQEFEDGLQDLCVAEHIGVISYFSLARGFLSGKYRPDRELPASVRAQGVQKLYMNERGFSILHAVDEVAANHHVNPAPVALAWLIAQPGITAPIASGTSPAQVHELMQSVDLKLTQDELELFIEADLP
jgi:aryl-alcohol dehydrogenase-like predicted oxidoreductase